MEDGFQKQVSSSIEAMSNYGIGFQWNVVSFRWKILGLIIGHHGKRFWHMVLMHICSGSISSKWTGSFKYVSSCLKSFFVSKITAFTWALCNTQSGVLIHISFGSDRKLVNSFCSFTRPKSLIALVVSYIIDLYLISEDVDVDLIRE